MNTIDEELKGQVQLILGLLAAGEFQHIESLTKGVRLSADEIAMAIEQYGCRVIQPPADALNLMDIVASSSSNPQSWSIVLPLWTAEEGRSDLSLELTVIQNGADFRIELDDLHVL